MIFQVVLETKKITTGLFVRKQSCKKFWKSQNQETLTLLCGSANILNITSLRFWERQ